MHYHVWFVTKYRKAILEGEIERKIKDYFLEVAANKNYSILAMETNRDHVHLLLEAANNKALANIVRVLKNVSAKKILEDTPYLRMGNIRHFWAKTFGHKLVYVSQLEEVKEYIRNQKRIPHT